MQVWEIVAEYIAKNYSEALKIVEVGVGKIPQVGDYLKEMLPNVNVVLVDLYPACENIIKDDITNPRDEIYMNADLIYSIRPPEELQSSIMDLSDRYNSDIIIKPLLTEEINSKYQHKLKLKNYKRQVIYHYKKVK